MLRQQISSLITVVGMSKEDYLESLEDLRIDRTKL